MLGCFCVCVWPTLRSRHINSTKRRVIANPFGQNNSVWMSSIFEVLFLFWFVVMSVLSSWGEMDVRVELLVNDVWAAGDDITDFLSVGVNSLIYYIWKNDQFPCPWCKLVPKNENTRKEDKWESSTNGNMRFFYELSRIYVWLYPPIEKIEKSKNVNQLPLMNFQNIFLIDPFLLKRYDLCSQNSDNSLEQ